MNPATKNLLGMAAVIVAALSVTGSADAFATTIQTCTGLPVWNDIACAREQAIETELWVKDLVWDLRDIVTCDVIGGPACT